MTQRSPEDVDLIPSGLLKDGADGPDTSSFGLLDMFTARYDILARLLDRESKQLLDKEFGISLVEWRVLSGLSLRGGMTVGELARMSGFDKSQISRAAAQLEKANQVQRTDSPRDGRSAIISMTEAGQKLYDSMIPVVRERNRRLLALFTPDQRKAAYELMDKLTTHLKNQMDQP